MGESRFASTTMAWRSSLKLLGPLRTSMQLARTASQLQTPSRLATLTPVLHRSWTAPQRLCKVTAMRALAQPAPWKSPLLGGVRAMSSWRLRPYATAGVSGVVPLSSLSAGFSKVTLSLLVIPWKALPMALVVAPVVWVLPAMYRMIFQNSSRHTMTSAFAGLQTLVLMFAPVPCMENLFSDLSFYFVALVSSFFAYTFFPEVLLHDVMFMHYLALYMIPLIPLAFSYMPMFAARSYLFL